MPIEDLARSDVVTAQPDTPVTDLARRMEDENVGSIVITEGDTPVGIVTDRDLALRIIGAESGSLDQTASNVMTEDLCTIDRDAGFYEATRLMSEWGVRRLPVTDNGDLVGIISTDDLTELLADEDQQLADVIRAQRPEY